MAWNQQPIRSNLKRRTLLNLAFLLVTTILTISAVSIVNIYRKGQSDIEAFRKEQIAASMNRLQTAIEIAKSTILNAESREEGVELVATMRYDAGEGYFWMTDTSLPYPTMVRHGIRAGDSGKILSDEKFNTLIDYPGKNLYQYLVEESETTGEAFADYKMKKPNEDGYIPKLAAASRIPGLNLIVYTGIYMDQVEKNVLLKENAVMDQIQDIITNVVIVTVIILVISLILVNYFLDKLIRIIIKVKDTFLKLSRGQVAEKIKNKRNDELREMTDGLNHLIDKFDAYAAVAKEISEGNLDKSKANFDHDDQMGQSLMQMRDNLIEFVLDINRVIKEQMTMLLNDMVRDISNISDLASKGKSESNDGLQVIEKMNVSFKEVLRQSEESEESFEALNDRSGQAKSIITTISDIASQTSLLAVNASIEASQAGELGKGFAVVAREIQKLAANANESVDEIKQIINGISSDVSTVSEQTRQMRSSIKESEAASEEASSMFEAIADISSKTDEMSSGILKDSRKLSSDSEELIANIESIMVVKE